MIFPVNPYRKATCLNCGTVTGWRVEACGASVQNVFYHGDHCHGCGILRSTRTMDMDHREVWYPEEGKGND